MKFQILTILICAALMALPKALWADETTSTEASAPAGGADGGPASGAATGGDKTSGNSAATDPNDKKTEDQTQSQAGTTSAVFCPTGTCGQFALGKDNNVCGGANEKGSSPGQDDCAFAMGGASIKSNKYDPNGTSL